VKKSVRQQVPAAKPKPRRKGRVTRKSSKKKRRRGEDDETEDDDDDDEDEDVIGGKNLSRYVAQVHSIPMEYLARLESRLSDEAVPHHRGLGNVQWPPLLNFGTPDARHPNSDHRPVITEFLRVRLRVSCCVVCVSCCEHSAGQPGRVREDWWVGSVLEARAWGGRRRTEEEKGIRRL